MRIIAAGMAALALVLTGCAAQGVGQGAPMGAGSPTASPSAAPLDLIGLWRVTGAEGEDADTWLRIDAMDMQLWRDCGMVFWHWAAFPGALTTSISGASGECANGGVMPDAPWLAATVGFEPSADGWLFRDAEGGLTAALTIDGAPTPIPTADELYTRPPLVDATTRAHFRPPAGLPGSLTPVTREELAGRWIPVEYETTDERTPFVEFDTPNGYRASDGCNGAEGGWLLGDEGRFAATVANMTAIGCEGANVPDWVSGARLAGFDGSELVLLDAQAGELGRLSRD
ncbi:hypothetical protein [Microbacterium gallinarum]|uniref:META domain-containing protein n=1 Tax=Microbacterium gallinarum TaxID=2762209 RepID=A0ABR8X1M6_9MICO|nr:hypothetical protein [Microbacterium gallinarum]MBD8023098.1 hypothetical protein [Microbacterium gallinarum]